MPTRCAASASPTTARPRAAPTRDRQQRAPTTSAPSSPPTAACASGWSLSRDRTTHSSSGSLMLPPVAVEQVHGQGEDDRGHPELGHAHGARPLGELIGELLATSCDGSKPRSSRPGRRPPTSSAATTRWRSSRWATGSCPRMCGGRKGRTRAHGCVTFGARARRCAERGPDASAHEPSGWQRRSSAGPPRRRGGWHGGGAGERRRASRAVQVRTARGRPRQRVSLFGVVPDEVRIIPLADGESGDVQGFLRRAASEAVGGRRRPRRRCQRPTRDPRGWWRRGKLARLVPGEGDRERILDIAAQVMRHPSFLRVRNALDDSSIAACCTATRSHASRHRSPRSPTPTSHQASRASEPQPPRRPVAV